jgi:hypothetical protein
MPDRSWPIAERRFPGDKERKRTFAPKLTFNPGDGRSVDLPDIGSGWNLSGEAGILRKAGRLVRANEVVE